MIECLLSPYKGNDTIFLNVNFQEEKIDVEDEEEKTEEEKKEEETEMIDVEEFYIKYKNL